MSPVSPTPNCDSCVWNLQVLTQLLASPEDLSKSRKKREEDEEKEAEEYQRGKKG